VRLFGGVVALEILKDMKNTYTNRKRLEKRIETADGVYDMFGKTRIGVNEYHEIELKAL
jgi:hypothetical protein